MEFDKYSRKKPIGATPDTISSNDKKRVDDKVSALLVDTKTKITELLNLKKTKGKKE